VISGMTYPLFVGLMAIGVVLFFLFFSTSANSGNAGIFGWRIKPNG